MCPPVPHGPSGNPDDGRYIPSPGELHVLTCCPSFRGSRPSLQLQQVVLETNRFRVSPSLQPNSGDFSGYLGERVWDIHVLFWMCLFRIQSCHHRSPLQTPGVRKWTFHQKTQRTQTEVRSPSLFCKGQRCHLGPVDMLI